jgi:hypothetical protein
LSAAITIVMVWSISVFVLARKIRAYEEVR